MRLPVKVTWGDGTVSHGTLTHLGGRKHHRYNFVLDQLDTNFTLDNPDIRIGTTLWRTVFDFFQKPISDLEIEAAIP